jgi:hypothetical protein
MSTADQDVAILEIVKGRAEAKRTIALLEQGLRESAVTLLAFGEALRSLNLTSYPTEWTEKGLSALSPALAGKIRDYLAADNKLRDLNATAVKLGID